MIPADTANVWNAEDPTACPDCGRHECDGSCRSASPTDDEPSRATRLLAFTVDELRQHHFPARPALLERGGEVLIRAGHLGEVVAGRGVGKTWLMLSLGMTAASSVTVLGFRAPSPCTVLYIDGEMAAEEIKSRCVHLADLLGIPQGIALTVLGADWQDTYLPRLDTQIGQDLVEPFIAAADLIVLDNRSCLFDPEGEKDPAKWQPAQDWLLSLRRRGKAVLLGHHANRQGGARGHSKPEDPLNLIVALARPDDYTADQGARFVVTFEKTRGAHGAAVAPFTARLAADGWHVEGAGHTSVAARLREYVRLADGAGERVRTATAAIHGAGVNKQQGLAAWAGLLQDGAIGRHPNGGFHVVR